jgi:predicted CopG family antitoxin
MSLQTQKQRTVLKMIAVSEDNYLVLKSLGHAGDSFNDVVTEVLKKVKNDGKDGVVNG